MAAAGLDYLVKVGLPAKYYGVATATLLFYDHLLTLDDEIKYFWKAGKVWTFWLFLANRYFPMTYQIWQLSHTACRFENICDGSGWYITFSYTIVNLLAQVALTLRVFAVTQKNIPIAIGLGIITLAQVSLGMTIVGLESHQPAAISHIPALDSAFLLCNPSQHNKIEIAYTCMSLCYDFLAFFLTIFSVVRARTLKVQVPAILRTITRDTTWYFLIIFTSHFFLVMVLTVGKNETLQLLSGLGNVVYIPVMISRLMISLRKAADPERREWSQHRIPSGRASHVMKFFRPQRTTRDEGSDGIVLDTYLESQRTAVEP